MQAVKDWLVTEVDRELFLWELDRFVPPTIFAAHGHWCGADHFPAAAMPMLVKSGPSIAGSDAFAEFIGQWIPNRTTEGPGP